MIKAGIVNLIIEEFLNRNKNKRERPRRDSEVGVPLELPLYDIPYWPKIPTEKKPEDEEDDENDIYRKGDNIIIIQMSDFYS